MVIRKEDGYLLAVFVLMAIAILAKSYFTQDGYLSRDSTYYLALAQNLLNGNGFYTSAANTEGKKFFTIWPAGYPIGIFLIAKITGLTVFWASKVLNIVFVGLILICLRKFFKADAYVYSLILFFSSFLGIFSHTWSETGFILALIWFSGSVANFILKSDNLVRVSTSILLSSLSLFLFRYIGAFNFIVLGLLSLYFLITKKFRKFVFLIGISAINVLFMLGYLYHNFLKTGYMTGGSRTTSVESNLELFVSLVKSIIQQLIIFTTSMQGGFLLFYLPLIFLVYRYRKRIFRFSGSKRPHSFVLPAAFLIAGSAYLIALCILRWNTAFDLFGYRLIAPGSILIFIGLINIVTKYVTHEHFRVFGDFLFFVALTSWMINVPYQISNQKVTYLQNVDEIHRKYNNVGSNSVIAFGSEHVRYLRPDIILENPKNDENWSEFLRRTKMFQEGQRDVYLDVEGLKAEDNTEAIQRSLELSDHAELIDKRLY